MCSNEHNIKKQFIKTKTIFEWKNFELNLNKVPCVFLIQ